MTAVFTLTLGLLSVAAMGALVRAVRGPRVLDRIIAVEALVTLIIAGAAVGIAARQEQYASVLVVLALLGFIGSVAAARLIEEREDMR